METHSPQREDRGSASNSPFSRPKSTQRYFQRALFSRFRYVRAQASLPTGPLFARLHFFAQRFRDLLGRHVCFFVPASLETLYRHSSRSLPMRGRQALTDVLALCRVPYSRFAVFTRSTKSLFVARRLFAESCPPATPKSRTGIQAD